MMKCVEKTYKASAPFSLNPKQMQKSRFGSRYFESPEAEHEALAGKGEPLFSYNLVNLPRFPAVQRKESEDEEFQMKPSRSCPECEEEEIQAKSSGDRVTPTMQKQAEPKPNRTGMPNQMKAGIESLSGLDMSDVRVHANSNKPVKLNALAYTQGNEIHLGPGQERHLPHEAWHVVQQKQGRVHSEYFKKGYGINSDQYLEKEATNRGVIAASTLPIYHRNNNPKRISVRTTAPTIQLVGHTVVNIKTKQSKIVDERYRLQPDEVWQDEDARTHTSTPVPRGFQGDGPLFRDLTRPYALLAKQYGGQVIVSGSSVTGEKYVKGQEHSGIPFREESDIDVGIVSPRLWEDTSEIADSGFPESGSHTAEIERGTRANAQRTIGRDMGVRVFHAPPPRGYIERPHTPEQQRRYIPGPGGTRQEVTPESEIEKTKGELRAREWRERQKGKRSQPPIPDNT